MLLKCLPWNSKYSVQFYELQKLQSLVVGKVKRLHTNSDCIRNSWRIWTNNEILNKFVKIQNYATFDASVVIMNLQVVGWWFSEIKTKNILILSQDIKLKMKKFYINFTESRWMKIDVWKEEIKLDLGKKESWCWYKQNNSV